VFKATLILLAALCGAAASAQDLARPPGYQLVWADEFDHDGLPDPAKWSHDTGMNRQGWHNRELQYYSAPRLENARVQGGRLHISARHEALRDQPDWGGQAYTSARLVTQGHAEWTYGYFEIRAKLPCGRGTWPAIWMLGSGGHWPDDGELDLLEQVGRNPQRVFATVHTRTGSGGQAPGGAMPLATACTRFHTYQMHWTADEIRFGVDGFMHFRFPRMAGGTSSWPFDKPQYLILNLAIGGDLGGAVDDRIFPRALEVDYVRVYQAPASVPASAASAASAP